MSTAKWVCRKCSFLNPWGHETCRKCGGYRLASSEGAGEGR